MPFRNGKKKQKDKAEAPKTAKLMHMEELLIGALYLFLPPKKRYSYRCPRRLPL